MAFDTLVQVDELLSLVVSGGDLFLLDCEFDLSDPERGRAIFREGHLPGARYADLERDLSGPVTGANGRHPLPARTALAATMRRMGLRQGQQVVVYDGNGGIFAARAWWLLRWLGHKPVAVLDGGRQAWVEAGLPLESGGAMPAPEGDFALAEPLGGQPVTADEVLANLASREMQVIDARDPQRFAGAPHALDTVSGHIPGACNRFYRDNMDAEARLRSAGELRQAFLSVLGDASPEQAVLQCGSGVTACHNALAMEIAGLKGARLYPGSWSEWTSDPTRPVERI